MCGFVGLYDKDASSPLEIRNITSQMSECIISRGPDDHKTWVHEKYGLGMSFRRLSIQDLSDNGSQPMQSPSKRFVMSFNGEIYNHLDLRKNDLQEVSNWRGHSDTETILRMFEKYGIKHSLERMQGMFAIALWDEKCRTLSLIRDRFGEKPLYYMHLNTQLKKNFIFGSELKSFKSMKGLKLDLNHQSIYEFLKFSNIGSNKSIYKNTFKVRPGEVVTYKMDTGMVHVTKYWDTLYEINNAKNSQLDLNDLEAQELIENKLREVIKNQMISDVPLGAFLSGGIDSSAIVSLMTELTNDPINTFTIGIEGFPDDDLKTSRKISSYLGTNHTESIISANEVISFVKQAATVYDEPFADSSQVPTLLISSVASSKVKVALTGDGGDEIFCGYNRHRFIFNYWKHIQKLPSILRLLVANSLERKFIRETINFFGKSLHNDLNLKLQKVSSILNSRDIIDFYGKIISQILSPESLLLDKTTNSSLNIPTDLQNLDPTEAIMAFDSMVYLPDDILCKVDRASMNYSLETRAPYLDHTLFNLIWRLPLNQKIRKIGSTVSSKHVLRKIAEPKLPKNILNRPKDGFGIPISYWLRTELKEWASDLLSADMIRKHNILDSEEVSKLWNEHLDKTKDNSHQIWSILVLQEWLANE